MRPRLAVLTLLLLSFCGPGSEVKPGRELYLAYGCAACHGERGDGRGPGAPLATTKPRDLTNLRSYRGPTSVDGIAATIAAGVAAGRTGMPAYPDIPKRERRAIAEYLRSVAHDPSRATVSAAWIRTPNPAVDVAAGFVTIENSAQQPVRLVSVSSNAADIVEMHEMKTDNGMMVMQKVAELNIGPRETLRLQPGGVHLMLIGLRKPFPDPAELTLRFDDNSTVTVPAPVRDED
jgi:copper(I)-binding protein